MDKAFVCIYLLTGLILTLAHSKDYYMLTSSCLAQEPSVMCYGTTLLTVSVMIPLWPMYFVKVQY